MYKVLKAFTVLAVLTLSACKDTTIKQVVDLTGPGGYSPVTKVAAIKLSPDSISIAVPATATIGGIATDTKGDPATITFSSLDTAIATVGAKTGVVAGNPKGVSGSARIVGTNDADPSKKDTVTVMVKQQVQSITISPTTFIGKPGTSMDFTVTVVPAGFTFTCKSSNAGVVGMLLVDVGGVKKCRATFFALSPLNGASPVQVYAQTTLARIFPDGTQAQLQAGAEVRVTVSGT